MPSKKSDNTTETVEKQVVTEDRTARNIWIWVWYGLLVLLILALLTYVIMSMFYVPTLRAMTVEVPIPGTDLTVRIEGHAKEEYLTKDALNSLSAYTISVLQDANWYTAALQTSLYVTAKALAAALRDTRTCSFHKWEHYRVTVSEVQSGTTTKAVYQRGTVWNPVC
jgi:hypothetical protein